MSVMTPGHEPQHACCIECRDAEAAAGLASLQRLYDALRISANNEADALKAELGAARAGNGEYRERLRQAEADRDAALERAEFAEADADRERLAAEHHRAAYAELEAERDEDGDRVAVPEASEPGRAVHAIWYRARFAESRDPVTQAQVDGAWACFSVQWRAAWADADACIRAAERERITGLFGEWVTLLLAEPNGHGPEAWKAAFADLIGMPPRGPEPDVEAATGTGEGDALPATPESAQ